MIFKNESKYWLFLIGRTAESLVDELNDAKSISELNKKLAKASGAIAVLENATTFSRLNEYAYEATRMRQSIEFVMGKIYDAKFEELEKKNE